MASSEGEKSKLDPTAEEWKLERKKEELVSQRKHRPQKVKLESRLEERGLRREKEKLEEEKEKIRFIQAGKNLMPCLNEISLRPTLGSLDSRLRYEEEIPESEQDIQAEEIRLRQEIEKLESRLKETRLRREIEELSPAEETRFGQEKEKLEERRLKLKTGKLGSQLEEMRLRREIEKLEEKKLKLETGKLESQLEEMILRREIEKMKETILMRESRKLEFQLEEIKLRQDKEKLESQLEETRLERDIKKLSPAKVMLFRQRNEKVRERRELELRTEEMRLKREIEKRVSQVKDIRLRREKEKLEPPALEMKLKATDFEVVNVKSKDLTSSEAVPQQQRAPGEPIGSQHIIVLGGRDQDGHCLKSVEGFIFREGRWIELPPMNTPRSFMSAVLIGNEILVSGGDTGATITDTIEILNLDETQLQWITSAATLPVPLSGHQTVAYKERLITTGGHDGNEGRNSDKIYEVLLTPPYTTRVLGSLSQPRAWHGAELVNDKIFIFGGGRNPAVPNDDVLVYNLSSNQCNVIGQLPYGLQGMATVRRWNEVTLLGGVDEREQELDHVITYDTESGETTTLPPMTQGRGGCCAVISLAVDTSGGCSSDTPTDSLVALGSLQQRNTVESYDFQSHAWKDMPPTREARKLCTAVVSPINFKFE